MESFGYANNRLYCEKTDIENLAGDIGTPFYLYSKASFKRHFKELNDALNREHINHLIAYAVKANSNLKVIEIFSKLGAGADVVSGGEIYKALASGVDPSKMVYAGVGKTDVEIRYALQSGVGQFNVESGSELRRINDIAASIGKVAPVAIRVNPDINPKTHPYISTGMKKYKFGIPTEEAFEMYRKAQSMRGVKIKGVHCHVGSQLSDMSVFDDTAEVMVRFLEKLKASGVELETIDIGGGIGIRYTDEKIIDLDRYAKTAKRLVSVYPNATLICEPGRFLVGEGGALISKLLYIKDNGEKLFYIVDAAMTDLIRPTLYHAEHKIIPVKVESDEQVKVDIVGPVCESGDFLAKDLYIQKLKEGSMIAVMSAGAYGFVMSSHYNGRPNIAEVLVEDDNYSIIRKAENYEDLIKNER